MGQHKALTGDTAIHEIMYVQSSDPGAKGANKFWLDTSGGASLQSGAVLKQRDGTNSSWTTRCDLSAFSGAGIPESILDALGDLIYASADNTPAKLSGNTTATKKFLTQTGSGSASAAPGWNTIASGDLPTVPETKGGTNQTTYATGDTLYASASNTLSKLAGNTSSTKKFLRSTGSGGNATAPAWDTIVENDVGASTNDAGNTSTAITIDWSVARTQKVTATGNATVTHSNMTAGIVYTLEYYTGAGSFTAAFASTNFAGGTSPTLTVTASKVDVFTFYKTIGGTIFGAIFGQSFAP